MIDPVEGATVGIVKLALDAASMQHAAIANNIANANTPGFVPVRLNFDAQLAALGAQWDGAAATAPSLPARLTPLPQRADGADDGGALDLEAAELGRNTVHYDALLKALNRHFALLGTAINEGKR